MFRHPVVKPKKKRVFSPSPPRVLVSPPTPNVPLPTVSPHPSPPFPSSLACFSAGHFGGSPRSGTPAASALRPAAFPSPRLDRSRGPTRRRPRSGRSLSHSRTSPSSPQGHIGAPSSLRGARRPTGFRNFLCSPQRGSSSTSERRLHRRRRTTGCLPLRHRLLLLPLRPLTHHQSRPPSLSPRLLA